MKLIVMLLLLAGLQSCSKTAQELTLDRMDYIGSEIRIDGYYCHQINDTYNSFILFENGIYHDLGETVQSSIEELDELILDETFYNNLRDIQYTWGVFQVEGNRITIERWLPGTGGAYPVQLLEGEIVNDTTILISGLRGTKYEDEVDEFKFRQLSPKPDSTNTFIR
jgi:hypothetical protein